MKRKDPCCRRGFREREKGRFFYQGDGWGAETVDWERSDNNDGGSFGKVGLSHRSSSITACCSEAVVPVFFI